MAGVKLNKTVAASTLLEVVISMIVIIVVFGIAMMIFTNVTRAGTSAKAIRAKAAIEDLLLKEEQARNINSQNLTIGDFEIEETVSSYNGQDNLLQVQLTAFDQNRQQVTEQKKIILKQ